MMIAYEWRGAFDDVEVGGLHAEGFGPVAPGADWWTRVNRHSLGWVCARQDGRLVGFYLDACGFSRTNAGLIALAPRLGGRRRGDRA